jgi:hypothetical protein
MISKILLALMLATMICYFPSEARAELSEEALTLKTL